MSKQVSIEKIKPPHEDQVLLSRDQVRIMLGCSYHQVVLLEEAGTLRAIRLTPTEKAKAYYRRDDVLALTEQYAKPFTHEIKQSKKRQSA